MDLVRHAYVDRLGVPLFYVCCYRTPEGKTFLEGRPSENGAGWVWNLALYVDLHLTCEQPEMIPRWRARKAS
jgi:hypothetical protein